MKYLSDTQENQDAFYKNINNWIRDGSNLITVVTTEHGEFFQFRGKDGCIEHLVMYYEKYYYDHDIENHPGNGQP